VDTTHHVVYHSSKLLACAYPLGLSAPSMQTLLIEETPKELLTKAYCEQLFYLT